MQELKPDTQVYCTRCLWFRIIDDVPECKYQEECDIWDCEDSTQFSLRPKYVEKYDPCGGYPK